MSIPEWWPEPEPSLCPQPLIMAISPEASEWISKVIREVWGSPDLGIIREYTTRQEAE